MQRKVFDGVAFSQNEEKIHARKTKGNSRTFGLTAEDKAESFGGKVHLDNLRFRRKREEMKERGRREEERGAREKRCG